MADVVTRYEPRGGARELLRNPTAEILIVGPAGTGKTLAMLRKLHYTCRMVPDLRALLVRQTHASLTGTTLVTFERNVAAPMLAVGAVRWFGGSSREPAAYHYSNGSALLVGGLDRPGKFLSSEFDRIGIDEATQVTEDALEVLISRLRGVAPTYKQIICACNPDHPQHWLRYRVARGHMRELYSRHRDNPAYYRVDGSLTPTGADYMAKLDRLTGLRRLRLRDGKWAASEGVIFEEWDPDLHLIDPFPVPSDWDRWFAVDWGYVNPTVIQDWREDHDGRLYLVRELYHTKKTTPTHALDLLNLVADEDPKRPGGWIWHERKPRAVICDHDTEDREMFRQKTGLSTRPAKKGVKDGIQAVQERLKVAGDGKPRLFIFKNAVVRRDPDLVEAKKPACTEEEIPGYVWQLPGESAAVQAPKEVPLAENNHGCDAMRYLCAERESGRPGIRVLG